MEFFFVFFWMNGWPLVWSFGISFESFGFGVWLDWTDMNLRENSSYHRLHHRFHRRPFLHGSLAKVFLSIERTPRTTRDHR
jgi:hypothetical protein